MMIVSRVLELHPPGNPHKCNRNAGLRNQGCITSYSDFHRPVHVRGNQAPGAHRDKHLMVFAPCSYWPFLCWIPGVSFFSFTHFIHIHLFFLSLSSLSITLLPASLLFLPCFLLDILPQFSLLPFMIQELINHLFHLIATLPSILFITYWE